MKYLKEYIYENIFHKSEINEKLVVNKDYKNPNIDKLGLKNDNNWKKITIDMIDKKYADVNIKRENPTHKRMYNKDGSPTNWFAWWMILCLCGPMSRKETLEVCGLSVDSYPKAWADMASANIIHYDTKLRKNVPNPMSEWI